MSTPTFDVVRVDEVEGARVRVVACRVPEPPFDDRVTAGFALMLLCDGSTGTVQLHQNRPGRYNVAFPSYPPRGLLDRLVSDEDLDADPSLAASFIAAVTERGRRNEDPTFHARGYDEDTYATIYGDEDNLFQIVLDIEVTDPALVAHLRAGMRWSSTAYAPEP